MNIRVVKQDGRFLAVISLPSGERSYDITEELKKYFTESQEVAANKITEAEARFRAEYQDKAEKYNKILDIVRDDFKGPTA